MAGSTDGAVDEGSEVRAGEHLKDLPEHHRHMAPLGDKSSNGLWVELMARPRPPLPQRLHLRLLPSPPHPNTAPTGAPGRPSPESTRSVKPGPRRRRRRRHFWRLSISNVQGIYTDVAFWWAKPGPFRVPLITGLGWERGIMNQWSVLFSFCSPTNLTQLVSFTCDTLFYEILNKSHNFIFLSPGSKFRFYSTLNILYIMKFL